MQWSKITQQSAMLVLLKESCVGGSFFGCDNVTGSIFGGNTVGLSELSDNCRTVGTVGLLCPTVKEVRERLVTGIAVGHCRTAVGRLSDTVGLSDCRTVG